MHMYKYIFIYACRHVNKSLWHVCLNVVIQFLSLLLFMGRYYAPNIYYNKIQFIINLVTMFLNHRDSILQARKSPKFTRT